LADLEPDTSSMKRAWVPLFSLLTGLAATVTATWLVANYFEIKAQAEFNDAAQAAAESIDKRVEAYIALLRGCSGLFAVQRQVTPGEFRAFVDRLQVAEEYPGVQGIGFVIRTPKAEKEALSARMLSQGSDGFAIWPEGEREEYFPIILLEPADRRNRSAMGYDTFVDPVRRAAMERARDSGTAAASGKVTLVQEMEGPKQAGILIYVPVYREGDVPLAHAERRASLQGFVYSPFRAGDLFREIVGDDLPVFRFRVYDGVESATNLLHASNADRTQPAKGRWRNARTINAAGRVWTLRFDSQPEFEARAHGGPIPLLMFLAGVLVSLLLFYFTNAEAHARQMAEQQAARVQRSRGALRESEERMRLIVDSATDYGIMTLDTRGVIGSWNTGAEHIYGYSTEEIIGQNVSTLYTPEDKAAGAPERDLARTLEAGRSEEDRWLVLKNGERKFVSGISRAIRDEFGNVHGLIKVTRDITDRHQAEEQSKQVGHQLSRHARDLEQVVAERTAHLKESLASLEGILYHVAHDLRAPLRAMHGFTSILLKEYAPHFDATGEEYARRISEAAGRMDRLICDLLEYGRLAHMPLPLSNVSTEQPVRRVLADFGPEITTREAEVQVPDRWPAVRANTTALETILAHLVSNALKFVQPNQPPRIRIQAHAKDGTVRLSVEDNGIGIDPRYQDRVFRVFERLHKTDEYPGTGIGLAIVHKAAERIDATVGLRSTPGQGSTFWVDLQKPGPD
jgi:PAS domain S-box-containing protein